MDPTRYWVPSYSVGKKLHMMKTNRPKRKKVTTYVMWRRHPIRKDGTRKEGLVKVVRKTKY